ncbi:MAG: class I SAM-dependent methyltransferase [Bdellovibrionales bacterium]
MGSVVLCSPEAKSYLEARGRSELELKAIEETGKQTVWLDYDQRGLRVALDDLDLRVNYVSGPIAERVRRANRSKELIYKAVGKVDGLVLDGTAGLGRESLLLQRLGYNVCAFEKNPYVYTLISNALGELFEHKSIVAAKQKLKIHFGCFSEFNRLGLDNLELIYLDPMFPDRTKKAKVKKEMQVFHRLCGTNDEAALMIDMAYGLKPKKIVVKRPKTSEILLPKLKPKLYGNDSLRFEVYS